MVASWGLDVKPDTIKNCSAHCNIRSGYLVDGKDINLDVDPLAEVIEKLREQICSIRYNNPMDINFMLNHPDEEHVSYVPIEEEILERITNPMP